MTVVRYCREKQEKYTEKCGLAVILSAALLLAGCQSASHVPSAASAERPAQAMSSMDGVQDVRWENHPDFRPESQIFSSSALSAVQLAV